MGGTAQRNRCSSFAHASRQYLCHGGRGRREHGL